MSKADFDADIATARSASLKWQETLTPIEAHRVDHVCFAELRAAVQPMSPRAEGVA